MKIAIIGAGEFGQALSSAIHSPVVLYDNNPQSPYYQPSLDTIVKDAGVIFYCLPSNALRQSLRATIPLLKPRTILVAIAKGLEPDSGKTTAKVLEEESNKHSWALLHGPILAEEIAQGMPTQAVLASKKKTAAKKVSSLFKPPLTSVITSDTAGVAWAGALKNIYALAFGMADGLGWGMNAKGMLLVQAVKEMTEIGLKMGGKKQTFLGLAGLGDLTATAFSQHSRNRKVGEELAKTGACCLPSEGVQALDLLSKHLPDIAGFPLLQKITSITKGQPANSLEQVTHEIK
ncbi:MAG: NAD(P)H-dependent glycerol-3-phosphate dehydrogenase [bacterium]